MNNEELARKLEEFQDYLSISNIFTDIIRWIAWVFVNGFAWIVDMLENLTDDILLIKTFYNNPEIVAFVDSIRPVLYIFLAFSLVYTGYLLIFNKKFNREGIAVNIFVACFIILMLNTGMDKANEFTDAAIDAVKVEALYPNDESTLSGSVIQRNVTDLTEIDKSNWSKTDLTVQNSTPPSKIANINVREKYGSNTEGISNEGKDISKHMLSLNNVGEYRAEKFDQSGLEWNNEYYFRYSINWFTIFVTLGIIAFTLFSIALKLAKLFFELTFNYILALIIAPADIHDGQKTKKIIQAILNTFFATILIFLSMKIYMIGTAYLESTLSTFPYLIALIAFSLAVVDGPNIVERLFGIDAGLKNGWGVLAGAYAGGKMASGLSQGLANLASNAKGLDKGNTHLNSASSGGEKPPSPNDKDKEDTCKKCGQKPCVCGAGNNSTNNSGGTNSAKITSSFSESNPNGSGTTNLSEQAEEQQSERKGQTAAHLPNDFDDANRSQNSQGSTGMVSNIRSDNSSQNTASQLNNQTDATGVASQIQDNPAIKNLSSGGKPSPSTPTSTITTSPTNGSYSNQSTEAVQQTGTNTTSVVEDSQGSTSVGNVSLNVNSNPSQPYPSSSAASSQNINDTNKVTSIDKESPTIKRRPSSYKIPNSSELNKNAKQFARNK